MLYSGARSRFRNNLRVFEAPEGVDYYVRDQPESRDSQNDHPQYDGEFPASA